MRVPLTQGNLCGSGEVISARNQDPVGLRGSYRPACRGWGGGGGLLIGQDARSFVRSAGLPAAGQVSGGDAANCRSAGLGSVCSRQS